MMFAQSLSLATVAALVLPGCLVNTDEGRDPGTCNVIESVDVQPGTQHRYVVDSITLPGTATLSQQMGMDLDFDPIGRPDNAMGQVLSTVASATDTQLDELLVAMIGDGRILHLLELESGSLQDADGVGLTFFVGADANDDLSDNFTGQGQFDVVASRVTSQVATGTMRGGVVNLDAGVVPLRIALPHVAEPFILELRAARVEATVTADRIEGRLGGVLDLDEIENQLIPVIHASLLATIAEDCPDGICEPDSNGERFLDLFDDDGDGSISDAELRENALLRALLAPDIDMFDSNGELVTRCNDIKDSLSVGVGFTAVPATF